MRNILILVFFICMQSLGFSQVPDQTIGARFGGTVNAWGGEASYQIGVSDNTRLELDLGIGSRDGLTVIKACGGYHFVGALGGDFNWFGGPVLAAGAFKEEKDIVDSDKYKSFIHIGAVLGIDYYFDDFPLQLSVDFRPEYPLWDSYTDGDFDNGFGLGVRYIIEW